VAFLPHTLLCCAVADIATSDGGSSDEYGAGDGEEGHWEECDDGAGNHYYYNAATGETSWKKPPIPASNTSQLTLVSPPASEDLAGAPGDTDSSAGSASSGGGAAEMWEECYDESGDVYYYCTATGESAWEKPY
jgi:hypothetical protein